MIAIINYAINYSVVNEDCFYILVLVREVMLINYQIGVHYLLYTTANRELINARYSSFQYLSQVINYLLQQNTYGDCLLTFE